MSDKVVDLPTPSRGRGRPKGTGGNKRPDRTEAVSVHTDPGDNRKYLQHTMRMWDWPEVDMREPEQVSERIRQYFGICIEDDMKPSVAGMACAFGVDRTTLWKWLNGIDSAYIPAQSRHLIKKAYQTNGKLYAEREDQSRSRNFLDEEQHGLSGQAGGCSYPEQSTRGGRFCGRVTAEVYRSCGQRL